MCISCCVSLVLARYKKSVDFRKSVFSKGFRKLNFQIFLCIISYEMFRKISYEISYKKFRMTCCVSLVLATNKKDLNVLEYLYAMHASSSMS